MMFGKKKKIEPASQEKKEKPIPSYLCEDYPYKAIGQRITDLDSLKQNGVVYEIMCPECKLSIRSQGCNVKTAYEKMMNEKGCVGCGGRELIVKEVCMSKTTDAQSEGLSSRCSDKTGNI